MRPRGVDPRNFSTPERRSKPVAIAVAVNAVDRIANAITPGVASSIVASPVHVIPTSTATGITNVSSNCSPLVMSWRHSSRAWAHHRAPVGAAPGEGLRSSPGLGSLLA